MNLWMNMNDDNSIFQPGLLSHFSSNLSSMEQIQTKGKWKFLYSTRCIHQHKIMLQKLDHEKAHKNSNGHS